MHEIVCLRAGLVARQGRQARREDMQISDRLSQIKPSLPLAMNAKALELKD